MVFAVRLPLFLSAATTILFASVAGSISQPLHPHGGVAAIHKVAGTSREDLPGRIEPSAILDVRPQVNGKLQDQLFTEGSQVTENQPLYQIDRAPYQAAYDSINAQLQSAQADLNRAKNAADRSGVLLKQHAISTQDYDNTQAAYKQATAAVSQQLANLKVAQINLDNTTIRAPISGRIGRSLLTRGALVTAYQGNPLAVIQSLNPINVDIKEPTSKFIKLRQAVAAGRYENDTLQSTRVMLVLDDGTSYSINGDLRFDNVIYEAEKDSIRISAQFPNPDGLLVPGMNVHVRIIKGAGK